MTMPTMPKERLPWDARGACRRVQHAHICLPVFWKRLYALTFARVPGHAVAGDEYLARHLGSFLVGDDLLK
jgi:hypothetical protein